MKTLGRIGGEVVDSRTSFLWEMEALSIQEEENDPTTYDEAMAGPQAEHWKEAMKSEYRSLLENGTFQAFEVSESIETRTISMSLPETNDIYSAGEQIPIAIPYGIKPIGCKWVFKSKRNPDGSIRFKVRLVIRRFERVAGIDFKGTYAPVSKLATFTGRLLLSLAAIHGWTIDHMNVVTHS